jgi:hypothetical protein
MVQTEELELPMPARRSLPFTWLLAVLFRPARTMRQVAAEERSVWIIPLLLLTILTVAHVVIAGPLRQQAALSAQGELPPNYEWMSPEQQEQYNQAQMSKANTTMTTLFPGIGALVGLWMGWFLLGGILHLSLTLVGSRSTTKTTFNLAAWASVPFAIRLIVQIVAMLTTRSLINSPGVSGFIASDAAGGLMYARIVLSLIDLYLIWQFILLVVGAASIPGLSTGKTLGGVLATLLLLLALAALPGFIASQLGGLDVNRSFIFF